MTTTPTLWSGPIAVNALGASDGIETNSQVVALKGSNLGKSLVVWQDQVPAGGPTSEVSLQIYDALGFPIGGQVTWIISNLNGTRPSVSALDDGGYVLVYEQNPSNTGYSVNHLRLAADGTFVSSGQLSAGGQAFTPTSIDIAGGGYVAAWQKNGDIELRISIGGIGILVEDGTAADAYGDPLLFTLRDTNASVNGRIGIVMTDHNRSGGHVELYTTAGAFVTSIPLSIAAQRSVDAPDATALTAGNRMVVAWAETPGAVDYNIRVQIIENDGTSAPGAPSGAFTANATLAGNQTNAEVVALNDGGFVVFWNDIEQDRIEAQRFNNNGAPIGAEFFVANLGANQVFEGVDDAILLNDGRIAVTWTATASGGYNDVRSLILDPRTAPITGTAVRDVLTSRLEGATVNGLGGDDNLYGMGGNDFLDGGIGADLMYGGLGNDIYIVDNIGDRAYEPLLYPTPTFAGVDEIRTTLASYALNVGAFRDFEVENLTAFNTAAAPLLGHTLTGNFDNNVITGAAGNDVLSGGPGGEDTLRGAGGNDTYTIDSAGDIIFDSAGNGTQDTVLSTVNVRFDTMTSANGVEHIVLQGTAGLTGIGHNTFNTITGNSGANYLSGAGGNDLINGGAGLDTVYGGDGKDTLTGGAGDDKFLFTFIADSGGTQPRRDVITDFEAGPGIGDWIDLAACDANGALAGNQAFTFIGTAAFSGAAGELRYVQDVANNRTIIEGNVRVDAGSPGPEFSIELTGLKVLTAGANNESDIIL